MKSIIYAFTLLISFNLLFSQAPSIEWAKCFGGYSDDEATTIIQTFDGSYIVAGRTGSCDDDVKGNHGYKDGWLLKLNPNGDILWQKCLGGSGIDEVRSIVQTKDSGYIIAGSTTSIDGDVSGNHNNQGYYTDGWVIKLNKKGDIQWQKCLGGSHDETLNSVQQTRDGGYIIGGNTSSNDGDVSGNHIDKDGFYSDCWIVKLDSNGKIQWQNCFGGSSEEWVSSIKQTNDNGYIVAGITSSHDGDVKGIHDSVDFYRDCWIVKLDSNGKIQWQKCYGGSNDDYVNSILQTNEGGFIVAGSTGSSDGNVTGNHGSGDCWILKLNETGDIQWQKCYGGSSGEGASSIEQTSDGGYIIAGSTASNDGDVSGNHNNNNYNSDLWIFKIDSVGNLLWQKCLGGLANEYASSIIQLKDGGYVIAGRADYNSGDVVGVHNNEDFWVVKLSPEGTDVKEQQSKSYTDNHFEIYPNPTQDKINIQSNSFNLNSSIFVFNLFGQKVSSFEIHSFEKEIDVSFLPPGVYFIRVGNQVERFVKI